MASPPLTPVSNPPRRQHKVICSPCKRGGDPAAPAPEPAVSCSACDEPAVTYYMRPNRLYGNLEVVCGGCRCRHGLQLQSL